MDLSTAFTITASPLMPGYTGQAAGRGDSRLVAQGNSADSRGQGAASQARLSAPGIQEAAVRKAHNAEVAMRHGFAFEYEGNRQVMKVNSEKGILIYQMPSKGQLTLIAAEDSAQRRSQQLSLTA